MTKGINGLKSSLLAHVFRLIDGSLPPIVVLENVSFILRLERGGAMATLIDAFEGRGYRWAYRVVNLLELFPQRPEHVFLFDSRGDLDPREIHFADDVAPPENETALSTQAHGFYWAEGSRGLGWAPDAIPSLKNGLNVGITSPPAILMPKGSIVKPDLIDVERLQGFPAGWTEPASEVGRASLRWSLVGTAVSVPVAHWLGDRIAKPGEFDSVRSAGTVEKGKWPRAAYGDGNVRREERVVDFPKFESRKPLYEFLERPGERLSARATSGFLRRGAASTLRFVTGFLDCVRAHLDSVDITAMDAE
ncbi:DNA cytosine methyltransferase [Vannielia litorea]|nr:DNA cytosine methyltransferase [Vannielia litorea]